MFAFAVCETEMTNKTIIILSSLLGVEIKSIFLLMMSALLPTRLAVKMVAFVYGMPLENKERVVEGMKDHRERVMWRENYYGNHYREDPHYTRTDAQQDVYEEYYMDHEIAADRPRNQLLLFKRYARQLEQKIKRLEEELKCHQQL